eukprot:CAMPEP_0116015256 /NCGR_PEP_ID=MMETSP0321-20121206/6734_1 /TAXON_ID=163516 /ORGANISM="Leptocylindrus danicus var. danicus, Strain B650" /LENGTH=75 /DNA_ID=CAMNT_0003485003 /DNA_START=109 /DNA_END=336 /DNA_ORIENTATION=+
MEHRQANHMAEGMNLTSLNDLWALAYKNSPWRDMWVSLKSRATRNRRRNSRSESDNAANGENVNGGVLRSSVDDE